MQIQMDIHPDSTPAQLRAATRWLTLYFDMAGPTPTGEGSFNLEIGGPAPGDEGPPPRQDLTYAFTSIDTDTSMGFSSNYWLAANGDLHCDEQLSGIGPSTPVLNINTN